MVDALCVQFELLDVVHGQLEEQGPGTRRHQGVETSRHAVVVKRALLRGAQFEGGGVDGAGPLCDTVQRRRRQDDVLYEDGERLGMVEDAPVRRPQARVHDSREPHAVQEVHQYGMRADEVDPVMGRPLCCDDPLAAVCLSCIHLVNSVYSSQWRCQQRNCAIRYASFIENGGA